jgi:hypothetical protein
MKDFEDMSIQEREEMLEQIRNLPDETKDPIDLFTDSFNELSNNWSNITKEFDNIYSKCCNNDIGTDIIGEKDNNGGWTTKIHRLLHQ